MSGMMFDYRLSYDGRVPFFGTVYRGENIKLQADLADPKKAKLVNLQMAAQGGQTVAHVAAFGNAPVTTMQILKAAGADLTLEDSSGRTPFDVAANAADPKMLQYLLSLPVVKNYLFWHPDKLNRTPLHALCMPGSSPHEKRRAADLAASFKLVISQYKSLHEQQLALITKDAFDISPIMYAKHFGFTEILDQCVELGFDQDAIPSIPAGHPALDVDYWGRPTSGLMEAAFDKDYEKVAQILRVPTNANNPNLTNPQFGNQNALHYAVRGGDDTIVALILQDQRTNPLAVDDFGSTALHFAGSRGNAAIMQELLLNAQIKRNVNIKDIHGMTALHALATAATGPTRLDALQLLLDSGANVFARNNNGHTAYDIAKRLGHTKVAAKLHEVMRQKRAEMLGCGTLWSYTSKIAKSAQAKQLNPELTFGYQHSKSTTPEKTVEKIAITTKLKPRT